MAFYYYCEQDVDYVVLEVGLGGRYDATNVIKSPLCKCYSFSKFRPYRSTWRYC